MATASSSGLSSLGRKKKAPGLMDQIGNFFGGDKKRKSKVRKGESLICFKDTPLKYYGLFLCSVLIWGTIVWLMVLADCDLQEFVTSFCFNLLRFDVIFLFSCDVPKFMTFSWNVLICEWMALKATFRHWITDLGVVWDWCSAKRLWLSHWNNCFVIVSTTIKCH